MKIPCIILGGGLSGLAAAIRLSRYIPGVLLLEKHHRLGGLNSYYRKNGVFFETGLHAVTNYADAKDRHAPLNKLLRQLKISRSQLQFHQQKMSEVCFPLEGCSLRFSNDIEKLRSEIDRNFPHCSERFSELLRYVEQFDPFTPAPYRSARGYLLGQLHDRLLVDMLLCPLLYYGSSVENDMDMSQFIIMFRSIFLEGMFRPSGTIQTFINTLQSQLESLGGEIRLNNGVTRILHDNRTATGVEMENGERITCDFLVSTVGLSETYELLGLDDPYSKLPRIGFVESIFHFSPGTLPARFNENTVFFYNMQPQLQYAIPGSIVDYNSGVICFPGNFKGRPPQQYPEVRATHLANHCQWKKLEGNTEEYRAQKAFTAARSLEVISELFGDINATVACQDTFTPLTINRFTGKKHGAIYGCPTKIKDGNIGFDNIFIAGTDQGFLGIVGSMLSGVSMVNQHILPKI